MAVIYNSENAQHLHTSSMFNDFAIQLGLNDYDQKIEVYYYSVLFTQV